MLISQESTDHLIALGKRLRAERLRRNETQTVFAARIGASAPTLLRMESGDPRVQFAFWVAALDILNRGAELDQLLANEDLFERFEQEQMPRRQRASRRKAGK